MKVNNGWGCYYVRKNNTCNMPVSPLFRQFPVLPFSLGSFLPAQAFILPRQSLQFTPAIHIDHALVWPGHGGQGSHLHALL
ncbi:MAG: hypothetical protein JWO94_2442 [Verrucomicrobiaceae bacterium]|nr:hypothetical protein [Verrucomicrobiaceae bacterium]